MIAINSGRECLVGEERNPGGSINPFPNLASQIKKTQLTGFFLAAGKYTASGSRTINAGIIFDKQVL